MKKYLAYGANMDLTTMAYRCPQAKLIGVGVLEDYRLMFKGAKPYSFATIEQWDGYQVPFVLWDISPTDEQSLDQYEGYPNHYQKATALIEFGGDLIQVMFYQKPEEESVNAPSLHYYDALAKAYEYHGFDEKILKSAFDFSDYKFFV